MEVITSATKDKKTEDFYIGWERDLDGLSLKIKSSFIEKLMKEWSKGTTYTIVNTGDFSEEIDLSNFKAYKVAQGLKLPILPSGKKPWGTFANGIMVNDTFNLRFLTLVGLSEGVTIKINAPFSISLIKDLVKKTETIVEEFIKEYAKPVKAETYFYISVTEIKKEDSPPTQGKAT